MKSFFVGRAMGLGLLCLILTGNSTRAESSFVDPRLEAWLSISEQGQSLTDSKQSIVLYLKPEHFRDHSGLTKARAIFEESKLSLSDLQKKARAIFGEALLKKLNVEYLWSSNALVIEVDRSLLKKLRLSTLVDGIVSNSIVTLDDPKIRASSNSKVKADESKMTYGLQVIHADAAWNQGITGEGVTIGVIDTGVADEHPDLKGKVILKKDFTEDNNNEDGNGHGTHVSGTIVGGAASGVQIGVAPGAKLIMAKAIGSEGSASLSNLLKAMEWMLDPDGNPQTNDAPRLVSNSWGASSQFTYGFRNAVRSWRRFGIFPNFAAGNSGPKKLSANAPGSYPFSFAVGAIDEDMNITKFSSRGPVLWWKVWHPQIIKKPDISAPGLYVTSAVPPSNYQALSGTSMATPHIAGVVALALQVNPKLTTEDLIEILDTSGLDRSGKGVDNLYGHGVIQVDKVIEKARTWKVSSSSSFQDRDPSLWEWDTP
jgi:subtilisin family serine protease